MAKIIVGTDKIRSPSQDKQDLEYFCEALRKKGHDAINVGRGPNVVQNYAGHHSADIMVQIAGGLCICTLGDFINGIKRQQYKVQKGAIVFNMVANSHDAKTWKAVISSDWHYNTSVCKPYLGKTLPQVYSENKDTLVGFADGKNIETVTNNFVTVLGGGSSSTEGSATENAGGTCIDYIKQVVSDIDAYGVELELDGDTVSIHKSRIDQAKPISEKTTINNSVSLNDYEQNTPNVNGKVRDNFLITRFGEIPLEPLVEGQEAQVLQIAQRGHGHSIDCKVDIDSGYAAGMWVKLTLPSLGIQNRPYFVSKCSYDDEVTQSITLEPGPPSLYVEVMEDTSETEDLTDEDTGE